MYMDAKKLINQKNYIMKHKKITEIEVEEIRRELQESQRSHLEDKRRRKARTFGYHKGWRTEAERSIYNRRRNGNSSTKESDSRIKIKKLKVRIIR